MIKRLRSKYTDEQLKQVYATPHNHSHWRDHKIRVQTTIATAKWFTGVSSVADLSCGDATIANALNADVTILGDYAAGYEYVGPLEENLQKIPNVDLYICSETLEHVDSPEVVLKQIRAKTKYLVLSTPNGETNDSNPEHYWGWDNIGVLHLLKRANFEPVIYQELNFYESEFIYNYQIWGCK